MANALNPEKEKIIYADWSDVRDEVAYIRRQMSEREGREISEAEFYRRVTLDLANKSRKARGKKLILRDPSSTPGGVATRRDVRRTEKVGAA